MTAITETLSVSTSTVIRKLKEFEFKSDLNHLPEHMSWYEYSFKKGKMSFIAHDYDTRKIVAFFKFKNHSRLLSHCPASQSSNESRMHTNYESV